MIYIILGTKGQFIKMFPVIKLFDKNKIPYVFVHTSQHYGIIEENRKRLGVRKPDIYLTHKEKDLGNIKDLLFWAPKVLWNARKLPIKKGDYVINHGDTESTLLTFFIGKFFGAKVVQVEAGLRSGDFLNPFPEEIIRVFVCKFSDVNFCPYEDNAKNLKGQKNVIVTHGNTVHDSVAYATEKDPSDKTKEIIKRKYVLFLVHRKENVMIKSKFESIIGILESIISRGHDVVWPVHENTTYELESKGLLRRVEKLVSSGKLSMHKFFDYVDFMHLVKSCQFVASDGGGLQAEVYALNKPMLVLRTKVDAQFNIGQTAYMSNFDMQRVEYFLDNYKQFKRKDEVKGSPSQIVVNYFLDLKKQGLL